MTPIERIRRNRDMLQMSKEITAPEIINRDFPRNPIGLTLVMITVLPLAFKAVTSPTAANILGYSLFSLGFGLGLVSLAHGQKLKAIFDSKIVAEKSPIPYKMIGAFIMGLTAMGLTLFQGGSIAQSVLLLPVVAGLTVLSFGIDPRRHKGLNTASERQAHKVEQIAGDVGVQLSRVNRSVALLAIPEVMVQVHALDKGVNALLDAVSHDPSRVGTVRKYFTVYIQAAADASERFGAVYSGSGDKAAKAAYIQLLTSLADSFDAKAHDYASAGSDQLDIEIKVLNGYLDRAT